MAVRSLKQTLVTATGGVDDVLPPNPHRVGLFVSVVLTTTTVRWAFGRVTSSDEMQFACSIHNSPNGKFEEDIGSAVQYGVFVFAAAGVVVLLTEVIES